MPSPTSRERAPENLPQGRLSRKPFYVLNIGNIMKEARLERPPTAPMAGHDSSIATSAELDRLLGCSDHLRQIPQQRVIALGAADAHEQVLRVGDEEVEDLGRDCLSVGLLEMRLVIVPLGNVLQL